MIDYEKLGTHMIILTATTNNTKDRAKKQQIKMKYINGIYIYMFKSGLKRHGRQTDKG